MCPYSGHNGWSQCVHIVDIMAGPNVSFNSIISHLKNYFLQLSSERVTDLLASLGVATDEGVGVPYHEFLPHLLSEIKQN